MKESLALLAAEVNAGFREPLKPEELKAYMEDLLRRMRERRS